MSLKQKNSCHLIIFTKEAMFYPASVYLPDCSSFTYFLHDRSQVTKVGRHISQRISLISGVVQGSCLGPLLFLIYINDLVSVFNTSVTPKLYADDLKLYACLSCSSSCADFQQNLDRLTEWANVWQLTISIKKCCIMRVGNRQALDDGPLHQFVLYNDTLLSMTLVS